MTDRRFVCLLLIMFLALQTLSGLHAGSKDVTRLSTRQNDITHGTLHQQLFGALESRSSSTAAHMRHAAHAPDSADRLSGLHSDSVCDLLDHILNAPGSTRVTAATDNAVRSDITPQKSAPARLSRFHRHGPPARGPPTFKYA